jgi:hypothetical protein
MFLHVANGSATTNLIQAAGIPGHVSIWADALYDGPVPDGLSDTELLRLRAGDLADLAETPYAEVVRGLQAWREVIERVDSYDELVLWFEHDLFDQLNLIQLLSWLKGRLLSRTVVSLIEVGKFPGRSAFKGLGELTPGELKSLLETRRPVAEERYVLAERAWSALRQETPEALDELRHADTRAMPFLSTALKRFLEEYPWTADGLSRSERRLLSIASSDPVELIAAFSLMHQDETAYYITDLSLLSLLKDFSRPSQPLVSISGTSLRKISIQNGTVTITEKGRAILNGELDRVATYGIDRWFGGTHITGRDKVWRWDDASDRPVLS